MVVSTLRGARLYHDGQFEGLKIRIPVFLARGPEEPVDRTCAPSMSGCCAPPPTRPESRRWQLCDAADGPTTSPTASSCQLVLVRRSSRHLVVVNFAAPAAQARVRLPWPDLAGREWQLADLLNSRSFARDGQEIADSGLYVALDPWACHFLSFAA